LRTGGVERDVHTENDEEHLYQLGARATIGDGSPIVIRDWVTHVDVNTGGRDWSLTLLVQS